jgi:4-amino-4-deoxy-L-arabinose transferase-like glycosyltransferase
LSGSLILVVLLALTLLAGALRLHGLAAPNGQLTKDEAKLALAAEGVLQTGLPTMPSGRVYTRGMLNSYLIAGSFAVLGPTDLAARLPSVLAGLLLVPLVFLMARLIAGWIAALGAAAFVALAQPLVEWSATAWLPSLYLLLVLATTYCWYRGFVRNEGRWQVLGGVSLLLSLLAYEFGILLLAAIGLFLAWRLARRDLAWFQGRPTWAALGLLASSFGLFLWLALSVRAGTLAGSLSEVQGYVAPGLQLSTALVYLRAFFQEYWLLIALTGLGWPLLARANLGATVLLTLTLALIVLVPSFVLQAKTEIRYVLPSLPLLAILAAGGSFLLVQAAARGLRLGRPAASAVAALAVVAVVAGALHDDLTEAGDRLRRPAPRSTWLQTLEQQEIGPDDLLLTEGPERLRFYLGRADYHIYSRREFNDLDRDSADDQGRYSYAADDGIRSIYTNSLLLGAKGDFERLVEQPNHGKTLWVIGEESTIKRLAERMDDDLWPSLHRSARRRTTTDDDWIIMRIALPLRYRHD